MSTWKLIIDVARCEGCHNCLLACKDEHVGNAWPGYALPQRLHGDHWIRIPKRERGEYPLIDVVYRPTPCMHCDSPACAKAVPDAVVKRADGIVLIDPDKAKGRKELVDACPYGAIQWNDDLGVPQKCTLCAHLLDDGWSKPRCVQSCPTGALTIVKTDDSGSVDRPPSDQFEALHPEFNTRPSVLYVNLSQYTTCFVAGSVSKRQGGVADCLKGASIRLYKGTDQIGEATTDCFGDFRFDGLNRGEAGLSLKVRVDGFEDQHMTVDTLSDSVSLDIVMTERAAGDGT